MSTLNYQDLSTNYREHKHNFEQWRRKDNFYVGQITTFDLGIERMV